ncbi:MAG: tRNA (guanosine(37)-N1)-methyltransferase TrmD, partial [Candidatus Liptonbacteria bacterium]|nr:tRNA (guanosine(37)-N1)-methyltransferase TrmD [Candidatus Liptonbacteria bacterium]
MRFDIVTIFPKIFDSYLEESLIKRAIAKKIIQVKAHNLRDYSLDRHNKVDDRPYGGGPGMVMAIEPIYRASEFLKSKVKSQKSKA